MQKLDQPRKAWQSFGQVQQGSTTPCGNQSRIDHNDPAYILMSETCLRIVGSIDKCVHMWFCKIDQRLIARQETNSVSHPSGLDGMTEIGITGSQCHLRGISNVLPIKIIGASKKLILNYSFTI